MSVHAYWNEKITGDIAGPYTNTNVRVQISEEYSRLTGEVGPELTNKVLTICNNKDDLINLFFLCCAGRILHKHEFSKEIILCQSVRNVDFDSDNINNILLLKSVLNDRDMFKDYLYRIQKEYKESYSNINYDVKDFLNFDMISSIICLKGYNNVGVDYIGSPHCIISFDIVDGSTTIEVSYKKTFYSPSFIKSFICQIETALTKAVDDTSVLFSHTDVISDKDQTAISIINNTAADFREETILDIYYNIYDKIAKKVAVTTNSVNITYSQLEQYSNSLAVKISKMGVVKGDLIGIVLPRTEYIFVAQLAILKLGCAYVPIDPSYPTNRIDYIIEKSSAKAIVTDKRTWNSSKENTIFIDSIDWEADCSKLDVQVYPDDLAYVIYTSGSTGEPKGVMISHLAVVNFIKSLHSKLELDEHTNILSITTISFDIFVLESLLPLSKGLTITLADELCQNDPIALSKLLTKSDVNVIQTTPSRMKMLIGNQEFSKAIKNIQYIIIGGEPFPDTLLYHLRHMTDAMIYNMYGPTETTVWSTMKDLTDSNHITIGCPVHNTEIVILDQYNEVQPVGVPGEMCIGGVGLSKGYLNNNTLTKEQFILWNGKKFFKTGDIAFLNSDNELECLGRCDNQVKIRGYRIELAEIEEALTMFEDIILAGVIVNQHQNENKYLSAFFEAIGQIEIEALKEHLQATLPEYMLPSYYYQVENMPLTPNLKIDRKNLLDIPSKNLDNKEIIKPKNEIQSIILENWRTFLGSSNIGVKDNFFDIGGDSLKAVQLATQLMNKFDIDANGIFKYPTVELLEQNIKYKSNNFADYISEQRLYANKLKSIVDDWQYQEIYNTYMDRNQQIDSLDLNSQYNFKNIMITGASGYLGVHLLHEIIETSSAHVYILVRDHMSIDVKARIENIYSKYFDFVDYIANKERIHIVYGNIENDRLGLEENTYLELARRIDCIIHAAAKVSHFGTYNDFHSVNVRGTENLLEFALTEKKALFNHISTQGIGFKTQKSTHRTIFTEYDKVENLSIDNYYLQTKADAENLVIAAGCKGLEYKILRVGTLFLNSQNGNMPENYQRMSVYRLLKAFMSIGAIPNLRYPIFDFSFIDDVSKAIMRLVNSSGINNQVFHISNSEKIVLPELGNMFKELNNKHSTIDVDEFLKIIENQYISQIHIEEITDLIQFFHIPKMFIERANDRTNIILRRLDFQWHRLESNHLSFLYNSVNVDQ